MNIYNEIKKLEKKGIYIHFVLEHYNCNFSIEFTKKGKRIYQTGWYGDNNEFGDVADTMVCAIKIAKLFCKNNSAKKYFQDVKETITEHGRNQFRKTWIFRTLFDKKIMRLYKKKKTKKW